MVGCLNFDKHMQTFHPSSGLAGQSVSVAANAKGKIMQCFKGVLHVYSPTLPPAPT